MRALKFFAPSALLLLGLSACLETIGPPRDRVGLVTARAYDNAGTPVLRGTATFYRVSGLQLQVLGPQPCALFLYDPDAVGVQVQTLEAGNFLTFAVPGNNVSADRVQISSFVRYEMAAGQYLQYAVGDTLTVTIPGALDGFEPTTVKVRAAEPFTADTIPDYVIGQPLTLTWTPAPAPGSYMIASLRYNADGSGTEPNTEISCVFADDGSGDVPTTLAQAYANAPAASRSYLFTRARETILSFDSRTRTRLRALYDVPTPPLPPVTP